MTASPSALYSQAVAELSDPSGTDWSADTIQCLLVTSIYTFSAAHDFVNDITNELSGGNYARVTLTSKTESAAGGVRTYDAADPVFAALALAAGTPAALVVFRSTGTDSTSPLLAYTRLPGTAPDGGNYTVGLPSDGIVRLSPTTLRWVDVGPMLSAHANAADYDPNSVFASLSVSGNDITVGIDNSVSVDGTSEGAVIVVGDPASVVPGWVSDGTCALAVEVTIVSNPPDSKNYRVLCALTANTSTYPGNAVGIMRSGTSNVVASSTPTASDSTAATVFRGLIYLIPNGNVAGYVIFGSSQARTSNTGATLVAGQLRLCVIAGCVSATNDGPHSATVRIRVAAVSMVPS